MTPPAETMKRINMAYCPQAWRWLGGQILRCGKTMLTTTEKVVKTSAVSVMTRRMRFIL